MYRTYWSDHQQIFWGSWLTTVILTPGACEGRVWAAVHYVTSGRSGRLCRSGSVFQTSVSCTRNATFDPRSWICIYLRHKNKDSVFIKNRRCIFGGKTAPAGAQLVAPSLESTCVMYLGHKNKDSVFKKYRRCAFGGEKAPAGAHLVAQSLESTCFMYSRYKNRGSLFIENRRCIFGGKKAPAGAHLDAPSLESTYLMHLRYPVQKQRFSIYRK